MSTESVKEKDVTNLVKTKESEFKFNLLCPLLFSIFAGINKKRKKVET